MATDAAADAARRNLGMKVSFLVREDGRALPDRKHSYHHQSTSPANGGDPMEQRDSANNQLWIDGNIY
jgi:hypothetical protein